MKIDLTSKLDEIFELMAENEDNGTLEYIQNIDPIKFNNGWCDEFAEVVQDMIPKSFTETQDDYIDDLTAVGIDYRRCAHMFINIDGYLYDREALQGVDDVLELPYFKRILSLSKKENKMKNKLKQIIREEIKKILKEETDFDWESYIEKFQEEVDKYASMYIKTATKGDPLVNRILAEFHGHLSIELEDLLLDDLSNYNESEWAEFANKLKKYLSEYTLDDIWHWYDMEYLYQDKLDLKNSIRQLNALKAEMDDMTVNDYQSDGSSEYDGQIDQLESDIENYIQMLKPESHKTTINKAIKTARQIFLDEFNSMETIEI